MSSDSDSEPTVRPRAKPDWEKMDRKLAALPTLEGLLAEEDPNAFTEDQVHEAARFARDLVATAPQNAGDIERAQRRLQKKYHKVFKKSLLLAGYKHALSQEDQSKTLTTAVTAARPAPVPLAGGTARDMEDVTIGATKASSISSPTTQSTRCPVLEQFLISKAPRSQSGVLVVTVFTSAYPDGQKFSCQWNCYYCPNEPGQPRSYLLNEPGVRRANRLDFDPCRQFEDRVRALMAIGHPADKVELLVLGGTWESYPTAYRERFIRDLFYAANTIFDDAAGPRRPPLDLLQEQFLNETAKCKIIGVTLETRPDTVNMDMLVELRRFGCTRVQLGVQHTDDGILATVNRQATRTDTMQAIKLLKDSCFKVDIHLMPDLPGASPEVDKAMFDDVLSSPYLQADQWKIYPCQTTPFTVIEQWYREGRYVPYGLDALIDVLLYAKRKVHPWIRLNRVIRDIPVDYVLAGVEVANLRQLLAVKLKAQGECCRCIRCREVKGDKELSAKLSEAVLKERAYEASEGQEVFLSFETADEKTIFGFLRLRLHIRNWETPFTELTTAALIRELHVYGNLMPTYSSDGPPSSHAQHRGIGGRLLQRAEEIAKEAGYLHIAVISGIGVRGYYKRQGYRLRGAQRGGFLIKDLVPEAAPLDFTPPPSMRSSTATVAATAVGQRTSTSVTAHRDSVASRSSSVSDNSLRSDREGEGGQGGEAQSSWLGWVRSSLRGLWRSKRPRGDGVAEDAVENEGRGGQPRTEGR